MRQGGDKSVRVCLSVPGVGEAGGVVGGVGFGVCPQGWVQGVCFRCIWGRRIQRHMAAGLAVLIHLSVKLTAFLDALLDAKLHSWM